MPIPVKKYHIEEKFAGIALQLLFNEQSRLYREKAYQYIVLLTQKDFIQSSTIRDLLKIILSIVKDPEKDLQDPETLYKKFVSKLTELSDKKAISYDYFIDIFTYPHLANLLVIPEVLRDFAREIVINWKKRKKEEIKKILIQHKHLDEDVLELYLNELIEVETFSPFPEEQEQSQIEKLLMKASKPTDLEINFEYLYPNFLPQGTISIWVSQPSQGKSALALALSAYLLDTQKIDKVLYFDGDNPLVVLKKRKVDNLIKKYEGRLFYFQEDSYKDFQEDVANTLYLTKEKILIIIDTLRAFIGPYDINKGEVAEKVMALFKEITKKGNRTVILIHHVNKPPANAPQIELMDRIKGATEFRDRADIAYFLKKIKQEDDSIFVTLENIKPRVPVASKIHFRIDMEKALIEELSDILTPEEEAFINAVMQEIYLYSQTKMRYPNKRHLEEALKEKFGRNQTRIWLDKFDRKYWIQTYDKLYNQIVFKPIENKWRTEKTGEVLNEEELEKLWNGEAK